MSCRRKFNQYFKLQLFVITYRLQEKLFPHWHPWLIYKTRFKNNYPIIATRYEKYASMAAAAAASAEGAGRASGGDAACFFVLVISDLQEVGTTGTTEYCFISLTNYFIQNWYKMTFCFVAFRLRFSMKKARNYKNKVW